MVRGILSANVISGQVDHALGYTHNDMGPLRIHRPLIKATRVQSLAMSSTLMAALPLLMGTLVMRASGEARDPRRRGRVQHGSQPTSKRFGSRRR
jgi:hypothetical protein